MRAHVLALVCYIALLATVGAVGAYVLGNIIARVVIGLGG